jgi:hypothetical protein
MVVGVRGAVVVMLAHRTQAEFSLLSHLSGGQPSSRNAISFFVTHGLADLFNVSFFARDILGLDGMRIEPHEGGLLFAFDGLGRRQR